MVAVATEHLLAISGLHISMVAGSFYLILIVCRMGQRKAALIALLFAVLQTAVGGLRIPVQRAGTMACLGFLGLFLGRERNSLNFLSLTFLILLLMDTRSLTSISFQLSFLSLFCLILFTQFWNREWVWAEAWAGSAVVIAGTFPAVLYHFNTFSPIGVLANILAIPLFHLVLLTGCLSLLFGSFPWAGMIPVKLCAFFLKLGLLWVHFCAQPEWGYFFLSRPSWAAMIFYYAALGLLVFSFWNRHPPRIFFRMISIFLWCFSAAAFFIPKPRPPFHAVFFSAGANEIAHISFGPGNQWLINSGRTLPGDQVQWILQPYLRSQGIKALKGILFSDYKKRHTAGFQSLRKNFKFQYQVYPFPEKSSGVISSGSAYRLRRGDSIRMPEGSRVDVLGHAKSRFVFCVRVGNKSLLFVPEISWDVFKEIAQAPEHHADLLVIPSGLQADPAMLKSILTLTSAKAVIAPRLRETVLRSIQARGIPVFDLSVQGAVQVELQGEGTHRNELKLTPFLFPETQRFI